MTKIIKILFNKVSSFLGKIEWTLRWAILNLQKDVFISRKSYFNRSAKIQLYHGRFFFGGKIFISKNVCITEGVIFYPYGGWITLEENVYIGPYSILSGHGGLLIGKDTLVASHCVIIPSNHNFAKPNILIRKQGETNIGVKIGKDVWIGTGVKILDGVNIGNGCVIGAGAVVTKSLPDFSIAVGIPAKIIGKRENIGPIP